MKPPQKGKFLYKTCLFLLLVFTDIFCTYAQSNPKKFIITDSKKKSYSLPFKLISNLIIIPVKINKSDTFQFVLDTGLNATILADYSERDSMTYNYSRPIRLHGLGDDQTLNALHTFENEITIGKIQGMHQDVCILLDKRLDLSSKLGTRINGLIGYSLIKDFVLEINYERKLLTFYNPKTYVYKKRRKSMTIPLSLDDTKPYIHAKITLESGVEIPVRLLIDSGASYSIWLLPNSNDSIKMPQKVINAYLGSGLNGDVYGQLGRIKKVAIGNQEMNQVITAFPDSAYLSNLTELDKRNGSLGEEILRKFTVLLDYRNEKITLTPNSTFKDPFTYNMSGIEIAAIFPGLRIYTITNISEGSPADLAGLKRDDIITSINGQPCQNLSISDILYMFERREGKKLKVEVLRNGQTIRTSFRLVRAI